MTPRARVKAAIAVLTAALLAALVTSAAPAPARADSSADTVIIEMRVWQHVRNYEDVWVSARPKGGRWDTLGTILLPRSGLARGYGGISWHRYGDVAVGGVELRVWQRLLEPWRIYVQACSGACTDSQPEGRRAWRPPGMVPLPFALGIVGRERYGVTADGRYRYADLDIAVPRGNPGLLADREHLLALRDTLVGTATWGWYDGRETLNWDAGTPTTAWEGVTMAGSPPRVTGLNLANRGLTGEIWGYLGDLSELTELRLDGNALTGIIPSKLHLLTKLTHVYLDGNDLQGCVPPRLRTAAHHDLDSLGLPDCSAPLNAFPELLRESGPGRFSTTGTYYLTQTYPRRNARALVFDVPPEWAISAWEQDQDSLTDLGEGWEPALHVFDSLAWGFVLRWSGEHRFDGALWLFLDHRTFDEIERSHYSFCFYDCVGENPPAAQIEQVVASLWRTSTGDDGEWVWP